MRSLLIALAVALVAHVDGFAQDKAPDKTDDPKKVAELESELTKAKAKVADLEKELAKAKAIVADWK